MVHHPPSTGMANKVNWKPKSFYYCFAVGFFLLACVFAIWNFYLLLNYHKTEGVVASISIKQTGGKTPATFYEMWVGFKASNRQVYTSAGTCIFYQPYDKGDKVMIYYDPQKPDKAFINALGTIWFFPTIIFSVGMIPLILSKPKLNDFKTLKPNPMD